MRNGSCLLILALATLAGCIEEPDAAAPGPSAPVDAHLSRDVPPSRDGHADPQDVALPADAGQRGDAARPEVDARLIPDELDAASIGDAALAMDASPDVSPRPMAVDCFGMLLDDAPFVADYADFEPVLGRHCRGTDHQAIVGVQQVVFVGDALTTGEERGRRTAPMRALLADELAERYALQAPMAAWQALDPLTGHPAVRRSGDFVACAAPSATTSDLLDGSRLLADCLLPEELGRRTLFVVTVGAGDLLRLTSLISDGADEAEILSAAGGPVTTLQRAVRWMKDPARFPAGSFVVFSNVPDWTDGRGDTAGCLGWPALPDERQPLFGRLIAHLNGQYMRIAVENQADLVFMQEHFCGHGRQFRNPDPLCLGRPEPWVDESCRFLVSAGNSALSGLFWDVITDTE